MKTLRNKMIQQMQLKAYSQGTIQTYISNLVQLSRYFGKSPEVLSVEQLRDFLHHMITERKVSRSWTNQFVSALKILFCDVLKREWNPLDIPRVRGEKKLPVVLSRNEVGQIIKVTTNPKHQAILMLTYSSGLRLSEVRNLKIADIDSQRMQIKVVQGKGFKDRYSILSPVALEMLRQYWLKCRPGTWLFETAPGKPICQRSVQLLFHKAL